MASLSFCGNVSRKDSNPVSQAEEVSHAAWCAVQQNPLSRKHNLLLLRQIDVNLLQNDINILYLQCKYYYYVPGINDCPDGFRS